VFSSGFRGALAMQEGADRGTVRTEKSSNPTPVSRITHLVMVGCYHENDWAISGNVEGTPRTYLSKEDACDDTPEEERGLVGQVG